MGIRINGLSRVYIYTASISEIRARDGEKGLAYELNTENTSSPPQSVCPNCTFVRSVMERCRFSRKYEFNLDGAR